MLNTNKPTFSSNPACLASQLKTLLAEIDSPESTTFEDAAAKAGKIISDKPPMKILLVEDNKIAQKVTSMLLNSLGCLVDVAEDGNTALTLFEPGKYHLVFMDIGLPDIQGDEVSRMLKEMEQNSAHNTPILGLSAHAQEETGSLEDNAYMERILCKPLSSQEAQKILSSLPLLS